MFTKYTMLLKIYYVFTCRPAAYSMLILKTPAEFLKIDLRSSILGIFIEDDEKIGSKDWLIHVIIAARTVLLNNARTKH